MTKGKYTKGFTLVELLVVIAIIAILAGALFLVINPAELMKKGRDSKRMSELNELNKAIAATLANSGTTTFALTNLAASTNSGTAGATAADGSGYVTYTPIATATAPMLKTFMPALPRDPKNATENTINYFYYYQSDGTLWEINAVLESLDNKKYAENDGGSLGTCTTMPSNSCKFEVGTALTTFTGTGM